MCLVLHYLIIVEQEGPLVNALGKLVSSAESCSMTQLRFQWPRVSYNALLVVVTVTASSSLNVIGIPER